MFTIDGGVSVPSRGMLGTGEAPDAHTAALSEPDPEHEAGTKSLSRPFPAGSPPGPSCPSPGLAATRNPATPPSYSGSTFSE